MKKKQTGINIVIPKDLMDAEIDHQKKVKKVIDTMKPGSLDALSAGISGDC